MQATIRFVLANDGMEMKLLSVFAIFLCINFAIGQVCRTAAVCKEGGKWNGFFRVVPRREDYFNPPPPTPETTDPCDSQDGRPSVECPSETTGGGYRYMIISNLAKWRAANTVCETFGGTLPMQAFKNNDGALKALKSLMDCRGDLNGFWVPASDIMNEGVWKWKNGETLSGQDRNNFQNGQPDNGGNGQDCAYAARWNNYEWDDGECNGFWSAVCEMKL